LASSLPRAVRLVNRADWLMLHRNIPRFMLILINFPEPQWLAARSAVEFPTNGGLTRNAD
jgi:hypothetical protein